CGRRRRHSRSKRASPSQRAVDCEARQSLAAARSNDKSPAAGRRGSDGALESSGGLPAAATTAAAVAITTPATTAATTTAATATAVAITASAATATAIATAAATTAATATATT